jgi:hypothetical protein
VKGLVGQGGKSVGQEIITAYACCDRIVVIASSVGIHNVCYNNTVFSVCCELRRMLLRKLVGQVDTISIRYRAKL